MKTNYCIVTDSNGHMMFWCEKDGQLCYCTGYYRPIIVTVNEAKAQIKKTKKNRKMWGMFTDDYKIVPVNFSEDVLKLLKESEI